MTNGTFEWAHPKGYINIPVSFVTTIDSLEKGDIHRICTQCKKEVKDKKGNVIETEEPLNTQVEQRFLCPACEKVYNRERTLHPLKDPERKYIFKQSELKFKKDFDKNIVFAEAVEREYTKTRVKPIIHVEQEISIMDMHLNQNLICGANKEIVNNEEEFSPWVKKIHEYLTRNEKALLVTFGENGRIRAGFISATPGKLTLLELYAYEQIREPVQLNLEKMKNPIVAKLKELSKNTAIAQYDEFAKKIQKGEKIEITVKEEKVKVEVNAAWLDA